MNSKSIKLAKITEKYKPILDDLKIKIMIGKESPQKYNYLLQEYSNAMQKVLIEPPTKP